MLPVNFPYWAFALLISAPFHHGLTIVFTAAALMAVAGACASWMRGKKPAETDLSEPEGIVATQAVPVTG